MPAQNKRCQRSKKPSLNLILTHRCNLNCRYCLRQADFSRSELPFAFIKKNLPIIYAKGIRDVCLTGGEVTLYSKFDELIKLLGRYDFQVFLESNGININQAFIQKMTAAFPSSKLNILISLDHFDPPRHDQFRGRGTHQKAIQAITLLRRHNFNVVTNTVIHQSNQLRALDLFKLVNFLKDLGVSAASFSPLVQVGKGQQRFALSNSQHQHLKGLLAKAGKHFKNQIELRFSLYDPVLAPTGQSIRPSQYQTCQKIKNITVSYKGYHPCLYLDHIVVADLKEDINNIFSQDLGALRKSVFFAAGAYEAPCFHCVNYFNQYFKKFPHQLH